ncbi:MAG: ComF family protein [Panacagrimonas sp.]|nr:ComF family protein [Panacagrimonas sp.]MCC2656633.1 ComF family protein [Panacagrimonas sp.]
MNGWPWVDEALSLVAPERCLWCGTFEADVGSCAGCRAELPWNETACRSCAQPLPAAATCPRCLIRPPAFDVAWCPFRREEPVRSGIAALKYRAQFRQVRTLGHLMGQQLRSRAAPLPELLLPVPLSRRRLLRRGFNQAQELARAVSRETGVAIDAHAARMVRVPVDQIGQSAEQRRRNLRGAFAVDRDLRGRHVALIDDVMTTGATLDALARAARAAGATRIEAWALARSP